MGLFVKGTVGAAVVGLTATALWWTSRPEVEQSPPPITPSEASDTRDATPTTTTPIPARATAKQRVRWAEIRQQIHQARRRRLEHTQAGNETPEHESAGSNPVTSPDSGTVPIDLSSMYGSLSEQIVDTFLDCIALVPEGTGGQIQLKAQVISEPDVGVVVESVELVKDSVGTPAMKECLAESIYTFDFRSPVQSLYDTFFFTVDMDNREISAGTPVPVETLDALVEANPELAADLAELPELPVKQTKTDP